VPALAKASTYHSTNAARMGMPDTTTAPFTKKCGSKIRVLRRMRGTCMMLGLAFDGFLPFSDDDKFSMWPLVP
jgi:hypothetical protein